LFQFANLAMSLNIVINQHQNPKNKFIPFKMTAGIRQPIKPFERSGGFFCGGEVKTCVFKLFLTLQQAPVVVGNFLGDLPIIQNWTKSKEAAPKG
jgi:hypothetical protein